MIRRAFAAAAAFSAAVTTAITAAITAAATAIVPVAAVSFALSAAAAAAADDPGRVLQRPAVDGAARWRLAIVPGSGCAPLDASLGRMVASAPSAHVLLLQKPHLAGSECSLAFLRTDRLSAWSTRAERLLADALRDTDDALPLVIAGLSEGAELLPALARSQPRAVLLVMIGNAGLDPAEAGRLQARRQGVETRWDAIFEALDRDPQADRLIEGRHRDYWHDLRHWPLAAPLLADPRPLLHVWGGDDALVPAEAYARFAQRAVRRAGGYCALRLPAADHELRSPGGDRLQLAWRWLEGLARRGGPWQPPCDEWRGQAAAAQ